MRILTTVVLAIWFAGFVIGWSNFHLSRPSSEPGPPDAGLFYGWKDGDGRWRAAESLLAVRQALAGRSAEVVAWSATRSPVTFSSEGAVWPDFSGWATLVITVGVGSDALLAGKQGHLRMVDASGLPPGVEVLIPDASPARRFTTDADGVARVRVLPDVRYEITLDESDGPKYLPASIVARAGGGREAAVVFAASLGNAQWTGAVVDSSGRAVPGALVSLRKTEKVGAAQVSSDIAQTTTGPAGAFILVSDVLGAPELTRDAEASFVGLSLWIEAGGGDGGAALGMLLDVPAGRPGGIVELGEIRLGLSSALAVVVTRSGAPVPSADVSLWIEERYNLQSKTDARGRCAFPGLPPDAKFWCSVTTDQGERFATDISAHVKYGRPLTVDLDAVAVPARRTVPAFARIDRKAEGISDDEPVEFLAVEEFRGWDTYGTDRIRVGFRAPDDAAELVPRVSPTPYVMLVFLPLQGLGSAVKRVPVRPGEEVTLSGLSLRRWATLQIVAPPLKNEGRYSVTVYLPGRKQLDTSPFEHRVHLRGGEYRFLQKYNFDVPPGEPLELVLYRYTGRADVEVWSVLVPPLSGGEHRKIELPDVDRE